MNLSEQQLSHLHEIMEDGNSNIASTLEMLTGQHIDRHTATIKVIPGIQAMGSMKLGYGPLATVLSAIQGDVECDFLFLQNQSDFKNLCEVMGPTLTDKALHTVNDAANYMIADWLIAEEQDEVDSTALQAQMKDAITEMGSVLFGTYLTALYTSCSLATYQDFPVATLKDEQQSMLEDALLQNRRESNIAIVFEIECSIAQKSLKLILLMLPRMSGLRAMLDAAVNHSSPR